MKSLSLKTRITLWYTLFLVFIYLVVGGLAYYIVTETLHNSAKGRLKRIVANSSDKIALERSRLQFGENFIYNVDGVYVSAYNTDEQLLFGKVNTKVNESVGFSSDSLTFVTDDDGWYVYDLLVGVSGYGDIWVRGIASMSKQEDYLRDLLATGIKLLPIVFLFSLLGGYLITLKGLRPISKIAHTAGKISDGKDLSRRIEIGEGSDEIHVLADTFNKMFDRLQVSFEKEKQFTADVSHELRTPLTVIGAQCEYAAENKLTEAEQKEVLASVREQTAKLTYMVNQLLALARADSLQQTMTREALNFSELVAAVAEEQQYLAGEKAITVESMLAPNVMVMGDETMLIRLMINLVGNAVRYGKTGGFVRIVLQRERDRVICQVIDNGQGMAAADLEKIWQRFYQTEKSRSKEKSSGLGVGLALAKSIAEAHGGTITAESSLGSGSTFTVILPGLAKN